MRHALMPLLLGSLAFTLGCGDSAGPADSLEPTGTYVATRFLTTANGVTVDQLSQGVTLAITLTADQMTSGQLSVPAAGDTPLSLAGTWSQVSDTVSFHGPIDTFLQRLPFRLTEGVLEGDGPVGPGRIQITLTRQRVRREPPRLLGPGR